MEVVAGDRVPGFSLLAAGSGRRLSLEEKGKTLVLIFHLQGTAPTAQEINHAVRARYPSPDEVVVASVIDLSFLPPVYWLTVGLVLSTAYEKAASELPGEVDHADYVVILPDWGGLVSREYGVRTDRAAAAVVVDEGSNVVRAYQGERPVEVVLEVISGR